MSDLVFSNTNNLTVMQATSPLVNADLYHLPLRITLPLLSTPLTTEHSDYHDFKNCNFKDSSNLFEFFNWTKTFSQYNANDVATVDALYSCIKPLRVSKKSNFSSWVSSELKGGLIYKKKKTHLKLQKNRSSFGL